MDIVHVDMDAFFTSVEVLDDPALAGKPVIVGGKATSRGVVAAASYAVRKFGVHSAMPMSRAIRLCPDAVIIAPRMKRYAEISKLIHEVFARYTPIIEPISLDEAFLDVTASIGIWPSAREIGREIKAAIKDEIALTASVGIAENKFLAKLASDLDKPDGFVVITKDNAQQILDPLPIRRIWTVGKVTEQKLNGVGIKTIKQLRGVEFDTLKNLVGNATAENIYYLARGIDNRPVTCPTQAKSMSAEYTFATDTFDEDKLLAVLFDQVEEVATRLRRQSLCAKTITLKLRYGDFKTITRSHSLSEPAETSDALWNSAKDIFIKWKSSIRAGKLRLIGFGASNLSPAGKGQKLLFSDDSTEKQKHIDEAMDRIKRKYGNDTIGRKY
ncbi:MAG TPA: DNA polymerase IV [Phycisphaerales bacterium]|nr:DNA polymerase IV [Phycisphaerales bacterium]